jgi:phage/plasmid-like protein (TIGR03299 family)
MDNINFANGKHSFFSVKQNAWHGLGKILDNCPTSSEAIIHAGLDFEVKSTPVLYSLPEMEDITVTMDKRFITYRDDTKDVFDVVSDRYTIVQNKEGFKFFDSIVGEGQAIYETAGALGKGETIFITAKLPGHIKVVHDGHDEGIEKYLLLTMSHDGKGSIEALFTPIRVVCNNTLMAALEGADFKIKVRHSANASDQLEIAHTMLGITARLADDLQSVFNKMTTIKVTDKEVQDYILKVFLTTAEFLDHGKVTKHKANIVQDVFSYYLTGIGQELNTCKGTIYGAYNAISGYFNNVKEYKTNESRMTSNLMGDNAKLVNLAFKMAYNKTYNK